MKQNYKNIERQKSIDLIDKTNIFSGAKSGQKIKRGKDHPKEEIFFDGLCNIYEPIREDVPEYFEKNNISFWHVGGASEPRNKPTGHVLSSQVCCINHLFPVRHDKKTVLSIANMFCPGIRDILPIPTDKPTEKYTKGYIQFEAVSSEDYLNECKGRRPTRGSNCTSIDALIYGVHENGKKFIIPIEWKYTEQYGNKDKSIEDNDGKPGGTESRGKVRLERYVNLINESRYLKSLPNYRSSVYFFEPFYQLMRQTLWAERVIKHNNVEAIKADDYMHIHIIPTKNTQLLEKTYKPSGKKMKETWVDCLKNKEKYRIVDPMELLECMDVKKYGDLIRYLKERYWG